MKRLGIAGIAVLSVMSPLVLAGCAANPFDTRPACVEVIVNEASTQTEIGTDGIARKAVDVTLVFKDEYGPVGSVVSESGSPAALDIDASRTNAKARLAEHERYTAQMRTDMGRKCNPDFMVP